MTMSAEPEDYFIWSMEHEAWWRPRHCGYTTQLAAAGRYTKTEADNICRANGGKNERAIHILDMRTQLDEQSYILEGHLIALAAALRAANKD